MENETIEQECAHWIGMSKWIMLCKNKGKREENIWKKKSVHANNGCPHIEWLYMKSVHTNNGCPPHGMVMHEKYPYK